MSPNSPNPVPPLQQKNDLLIISPQQPNERPQKPESIKREISTIPTAAPDWEDNPQTQVRAQSGPGQRGDPVDSASKPPVSTVPFPTDPPHPSPTAPPPG